MDINENISNFGPKKITVEMTSEELKKFQKLMEIDEEKEKTEIEKEAEKKNHNFVQFYRDYMPELRWLMANHNFASNLFFFIIEHMDNRNALACSYTIFEDYFGKSRSTIFRAIKTLTENGFIDVLKMGSSNVYIINENITWASSNDKKKFAKYDGKILVSKKENKDYEYRKQFDRFKSLREREGLK